MARRTAITVEVAFLILVGFLIKLLSSAMLEAPHEIGRGAIYGLICLGMAAGVTLMILIDEIRRK